MLVFTGKSFVPLSAILQRPEIADLIADFSLELVHATRYNFPQFRSKFERIYTPLARRKSLEKPCMKCKDFNVRNHKRNFKNVYSSDYNYKDLSFDWD